MQRMLEIALTDAGFVVNAVVTGLDVLKELTQSSYDLLILDLVLPWINGLEVLARVRADSATSHLPVIVITGTTLAATEFDHYRAVTFLRKPFPPESLVGAVNTALYGNPLGI